MTAVLLALAVITACGDSDDEVGGSPTSVARDGGSEVGGHRDSASSTSATNGTADPEDEDASTTSVTGDGTTETTVGTTPTSGSELDARSESDHTRLTFRQLYDHQQEHVGDVVEVEAKAFFLANCPPPGPSGQAEPCTLTLHFADPDRNGLAYGERDQAIPGSQGGTRVTCVEGSGEGGACPGWGQGVAYEIVARVEHEVLGGRETESVTLDVMEKRRK